MSGKGSAPRPYSVDQETFSNNWDKIFKKVPEKVDPTNLSQELSTSNDDHPNCGTDDCCGECTE